MKNFSKEDLINVLSKAIEMSKMVDEFNINIDENLYWYISDEFNMSNKPKIEVSSYSDHFESIKNFDEMQYYNDYIKELSEILRIVSYELS